MTVFLFSSVCVSIRTLAKDVLPLAEQRQVLNKTKTKEGIVSLSCSNKKQVALLGARVVVVSVDDRKERIKVKLIVVNIWTCLNWRK